MKKPLRAPLWLYFSILIFWVLAVTAIVMALLALSLGRMGVFEPEHEGKFFLGPLLVTVIFSVILGSILALSVSKTILQPVSEFSRATRQVAVGDFSVRVSQPSKVMEIRELGENLDQMVSDLAHMESLSADFIGNVSHEFKTPLTAIEGYATLLQDQDLSAPERLEYLRAVILSARQLGTLADNVLRLSHLENQSEGLAAVPFRLDEQLRQVLLVLEPQWSEKRLELHLDLPRTIYRGSEDFLTHVWLNLLGNAIKFTPDGGSITVKLSQQGQSVRVEIADTGCGMSDEEQDRAFDKFYQGETSRSGEGNGLGLALAARVVALSGGSISVTSAAGQGSRFTVALP